MRDTVAVYLGSLAGAGALSALGPAPTGDWTGAAAWGCHRGAGGLLQRHVLGPPRRPLSGLGHVGVRAGRGGWRACGGRGRPRRTTVVGGMAPRVAAVSARTAVRAPRAAVRALYATSSEGAGVSGRSRAQRQRGGRDQRKVGDAEWDADDRGAQCDAGDDVGQPPADRSTRSLEDAQGRNAPLTPTGRLRLARCVVNDGWPLRRAAEHFDRSSRPHHSRRQTPAAGAPGQLRREHGSGRCGLAARPLPAPPSLNPRCSGECRSGYRQYSQTADPKAWAPE